MQFFKKDGKNIIFWREFSLFHHSRYSQNFVMHYMSQIEKRSKMAIIWTRSTHFWFIASKRKQGSNNVLTLVDIHIIPTELQRLFFPLCQPFSASLSLHRKLRIRSIWFFYFLFFVKYSFPFFLCHFGAISLFISFSFYFPHRSYIFLSNRSRLVVVLPLKLL